MPDQPRVVFKGSPQIAFPSLRALRGAGYDIAGVYTQPDRAAGRGQREQPSPVKNAALELGVRVFEPTKMRGDEAVATLRELRPDVCVVAAYGHILPPAILDVPQFGFVNVHASLLPRHRGASPIQAAILAGDDETGITIMLIDAGLDTGPILARRAIPIGDDDTTGSLHDRLADLGAALLVETLPRWLSGEITPEPQDGTFATFCPRISKDQGEIDWEHPAGQIWRKVRAYNPWPGAYTFVGAERLVIHEAWPIEGDAGTPGTVVPLEPPLRSRLRVHALRAGFGVATGEGILVPLSVQKAGRRATQAIAFARGERDLIGARLGRAPVAER
jgi:methionyl-tRNA formyltransferase